MKLGLSTDYGSSHHWERLIQFAERHDVDRLVFWGDYSFAGFTPPCLFSPWPEALNAEQRLARQHVRDRMADAARRTAGSGREFWYVFQVLMLPPIEQSKKVWPELFNAHGEPDMSHPLIGKLIRHQLDDLLTVAPNLHGIELWIMECASIVLSHLRHQSMTVDQMVERVIDIVDGFCREKGLRLAVDLHTAGGHKPMLDAIMTAAARRPHMLVSGDNVIGDFHLKLPFNEHLRKAAGTNPVQVHFDLNGEYWGRNFTPTVALTQYTEHIAAARALGAEYLDGRISTGHDCGAPHDNILPSRRKFYPALRDLKPGTPLPPDIQVCCFDTLGGFNAEYFLRHARDTEVQTGAVVREFLATEFGPDVGALAWLLGNLEPVNGRIFFTDKNYAGAQSMLAHGWLEAFWAMDVHFTAPAGTPLTAAEAATTRDQSTGPAAFFGWPVPVGHRVAGPQAILAEKQLAVAETQAFLELVRQATAHFTVSQREFVVRQFVDLVRRARSAAVVTEVMIHYFHLMRGVTTGAIPDRNRLAELVSELQILSAEWLQHYPDDRWKMAVVLQAWHKTIMPCLTA
jgi:hypothetical protein